MSVGELKRELVDLVGDPSFVFDDRDELIAVLSRGRKMSESSTTKKKKVHASPAIIPTIDEESEAKHGNVHIDLGSSTRKPRIGHHSSLNKDRRSSKTRRNAKTSSMEQESDSARLVEYFIVVSSKPSDKVASDVKENEPPNPMFDDLDARTEMRFASRCSHLSGGGQVDHVHLSSIGFRKSLSTSSTCSSDDFELSVSRKGSDMVPTSTGFSGVAAPNSPSEVNTCLKPTCNQ